MKAAALLFVSADSEDNQAAASRLQQVDDHTGHIHTSVIQMFCVTRQTLILRC